MQFKDIELNQIKFDLKDDTIVFSISNSFLV